MGKTIALKVTLNNCLPNARIRLDGKQLRVVTWGGDKFTIRLANKHMRVVKQYTPDEATYTDCLLVSGPFAHGNNSFARAVIVDLWFVYGNSGKKSTRMGHRFIQEFLENSEWQPNWGTWGNIKPDMPIFKKFIKALDMDWELV